VSDATRVDSAWLEQRILELTGEPVMGPPRILDDTTEFMGIDRGDVVRLEGELFLVRGVEREKRFGLIGEPKFWVKRALSLTTGRPQILKLVFSEVFKARVGESEFLCRRSADKEARVLEVIRGVDLLTDLSAHDMPHDEYVSTLLPRVLARVVDALSAIARLHTAGLCHGDIRNDHLFVEDGGSVLRWIDFDLDQGTIDFDVWSVGNILHFVTARRIVRIREVVEQRPDLADRIGSDDASLFFPYRLMNLGKIYPWLPAPLTEVLRRFAIGRCARYSRVDEVVGDLQSALG
jgi:hypothetical protein